MLADKAALSQVLTYHVVPGKVMAADLVELTNSETLQGQPIEIAVDGDKVTINGVNVIKTNIDCTNGVIHVIDGVLLPPKQ